MIAVLIAAGMLDMPGYADEERYDSSFFTKPTARAIEKLLLAKGDIQLLHDTRSIEGSTSDEAFGVFHLLTGHGTAQKKTRFYVFKEAGQWVAYDKLPTHKDNLYMLVQLATEYLTQKKGEWTGASLADDTWKNKDPNQRVINVVYDEGGKRSPPIALTFKFTEEQGWHITDANPEPKAKNKSTH